MPRQDFPVDTALGVDWPNCSVDAWDAYYAFARARILDRTVTVFDQSWSEIGSYTLDEPPEFDGGTLIGLVNGSAFVVAVGCNCSKPTRRVAKGDREAMLGVIADAYRLPE